MRAPSAPPFSTPSCASASCSWTAASSSSAAPSTTSSSSCCATRSRQQRSLPARLLGSYRFLTRRAISRNNPWRARRNVAHHYDLDHRLYELFLDADQQYSCAYFERPGLHAGGGAARQEAADHRQAARRAGQPRARHRLRLGRPRALPQEIGGAREVQGITLSAEQLQVARERAEKAGLEDSVRFVAQGLSRGRKAASTASSRSACSSTSARASTKPTSTNAGSS